MIKKVISGLLSAVMATALITNDFDTSKQVSDRKPVNGEKTFSKDGMSINSTNSLGNYINDAMQNKEQPKNMSYQHMCNYDVGFAKFDKETKELQIYSSQPSDVKLSVIFRNEDTDEVVYTEEHEVAQGINTLNTYKVEFSSLPEFFIVDIMLFDSFNSPVCEPYTITSYTRFTQEIKAADIYDFEEEYVVNLDEDDTTNFVVLNENTVKGETSEDTNILVSADYENDQYVFEHIDDTIRYLDKGDHFFIQPTKNDIIALSIGDISIDGDRATLTGDDNTEGLFDVIKIETSAADVSDAVIDEEASPKNLEYNGSTEDENGENALEYTFAGEYNYAQASFSNSTSIEMEYEFGDDDDDDDDDETDLSKPDFQNKELETKEKKLDVDGEISGKLIFTAGFSFEFYQKWTHVEFEIGFSPSISLEVECSGKIERPIAAAAHPVGWVVVPGLWFGFKPELTFTIEGKVTYTKTLGYDYVWSFDSSREKKFSYTCEPSEDNGSEIKVEANISISLDFQPMFYIFSENVAAIILSMPIELGLNVTTNNMLDNLVSRSNTNPQSMLFKNIRGYDEDTAHMCTLCYNIMPYYAISVSLELDVKCIPFFDTITISLYEYDSKEDENNKINNLKMYCSVNHGITDFGDCPYQGYKTTIDVNGSKELDEAGAEVTVDGLKGEADNYGIINFYCENGRHSYSVAVEGKTIKTGSFEIDDAVKYITVSLAEDKDVSSDGDKIVTTAPVTGFNMPSHIEDIPARSVDTICLESGRLGDAIFYYIYPNGEMNIHGSGEMYDFSGSPLAHLQTVKTVVFYDSSPEKGQYITSIGNNLFNGAENLETVYLSNEVTKIGDGAFMNCKALKYFCYGGENDKTLSLALPSKLKTIGNDSFKNCTSAAFGDIVFGNSLTSIGENSFAGNPTITAIYIPSSVTFIGDHAFLSCPNIKKADIRANITECGGFLYGADSMTELILPSFITVNGSGNIKQIFNNNANVHFNETRMPEKLTKVTVLSGKVIPDDAFAGLSDVETIVIPEGITAVGNHAFNSLNKLSIIKCVDETKELSFSDIFKNAAIIGDNAFNSCSQLEIGELLFGDNLTSIGYNAFSGDSAITAINIPASVEFIGSSAFSYCSSMTKAEIHANITGCSGTFFGSTSIEELILPSFITVNSSERARQLFNNNANVHFNETSNTDSIKKVTILSGESMPEHYLDGLYNITTLELPSELKYVGPYATHDINLETFAEVIYNGTKEEWANIVIEEHNEPLEGTITFSTKEEWITGDANGDGDIDMSDVVLIMQALANPDKFGINGTDPTHITENGFKFGDTNGDGLTLKDALRIQEYLLGKITSLV